MVRRKFNKEGHTVTNVGHWDTGPGNWTHRTPDAVGETGQTIRTTERIDFLMELWSTAVLATQFPTAGFP